MGWVLRTFDCADCGQPTTRKVKNGKTWWCRTCGLNHAIDAARSMANRDGAAYDRFRQQAGPSLADQVEEWAADRFL